MVNKDYFILTHIDVECIVYVSTDIVEIVIFAIFTRQHCLFIQKISVTVVALMFDPHRLLDQLLSYLLICSCLRRGDLLGILVVWGRCCNCPS